LDRNQERRRSKCLCQSSKLKVVKTETDGLNYPWRTREITTIVELKVVAIWIEDGETHHLGVKGQHESLITAYPMLLDHFVNSGFVSLEDRKNSWSLQVPSREVQEKRSKPLDLGHGRIIGLNPAWYCVLRVRRLGNIAFGSRKSRSVEPRGLVWTSGTSHKRRPCG
jgi:hypothetical protein